MVQLFYKIINTELNFRAACLEESFLMVIELGWSYFG